MDEHHTGLTRTQITLLALALAVTSLTGCDRGTQADTSAASATMPAAASAPAPRIKEHAGPLNQLTIASGQLAIVELSSKDGTQTKALTLSGKTVYDQNDSNLHIERAFEYPDKRTVLLLATSDGGTACPGEYRFISIRADGSTSSTDAFGTCSDAPTVALTADRITVTLPDMQGRGNESWAYAHEGLSKAQSIDASAVRNTPRLSFTEGEPTQVRGTLVRDQGAAEAWLLRLPDPTLLDGGAGSFCSSTVKDLPISVPEQARALKSDQENVFTATIDCPRSGPMISSIQSPGAVASSQPPRVAAGSTVRIRQGAIMCADLESMRAAIAAAGNPQAPRPEACVVMQRSVTTRVLRDSTPLPDVVIVEAGSTAAAVQIAQLDVASASPTATDPSRQTAPAVTQSQGQPAPTERAPAKGVYVNEGATVCVDLRSLNRAIALQRTGQQWAGLPDDCLLAQGSMRTQILSDSPMPGIVVVRLGSTTALVQRGDLSYR